MANELKEKEIEVKRDERRIGHGECLSLLQEIDSHKTYDRNRTANPTTQTLDRQSRFDSCRCAGRLVGSERRTGYYYTRVLRNDAAHGVSDIQAPGRLFA